MMRTTRAILLALLILPLSGCAELIFLAPVVFGTAFKDIDRLCRSNWPYSETDEECDRRLAFEDARRRGPEKIWPTEIIFGIEDRAAPHGWRRVEYTGADRAAALEQLRHGLTLPHELFALARIKDSGYVFVRSDMVRWEETPR